MNIKAKNLVKALGNFTGELGWLDTDHARLKEGLEEMTEEVQCHRKRKVEIRVYEMKRTQEQIKQAQSRQKKSETWTRAKLFGTEELLSFLIALVVQQAAWQRNDQTICT